MGTIAALAAACANPTKDYDDFQVGTKDVRAVEPTSPQSHDGGTACTTVPAGETPDFSMSGLPNADGLYFVTCLANLSECDLEKTLRFRSEVTGTTTGTINIATTSLIIGATSTSQTIGEVYTGSGAVNPDGSFNATFSGGTIPGAANSISQRDIALISANFRGTVLSSSAACSEFDGVIEVKGVAAINLDSPGDICLFTRVASDSEHVSHKLEEFHCP